MCKHFLLVLLISLTATVAGKDLTTRWNSFYSIDKMDPQALTTLASGLYYFLNSGPSDSVHINETIQSVSKTVQEQHLPHDCYTALVKAYEQAVLSYAGVKTEDTAKQKAWKDTLCQYYTELINRLADKPAIISFGKDAGKRLPLFITEMPQVDTVLNAGLSATRYPLKLVRQERPTQTFQVRFIQIRFTI